VERAHMPDDVVRADVDGCGDVDVDPVQNRFKP